MAETEQEGYTRRLLALESGWKRWLDVQRPYRLHLQRLDLGFVLDVGCGLGRNLLHLGGSGVGIDHNPHSVAVARQRGLAAFTPDEFRASPHGTGEQFDTILLSHVAEHLEKPQLLELLRSYLPFLRPGGRVLFITPQERGFASDPTHVTFMDFDLLAAIAREAGLTVERHYSFPFPRFMGRLFTYNEFVVVCRKAGIGDQGSGIGDRWKQGENLGIGGGDERSQRARGLEEKYGFRAICLCFDSRVSQG